MRDSSLGPAEIALYLDTNTLVQRAGLASLELSTVVALCREQQIEIVVPSVVADEVESSRLRLIEAAFDSLRAAHREAARLAPIGILSELPNPGELAREYRRSLGQLATIAETPADAPMEALRREAFRLRPARGGSGARDTAIWLTLRDHHLARSEAGVFVSNNSRDFAAHGTPTKFHPALANEVAHHTAPLELCPSLMDFVGTVAASIDPFVDPAQLGQLLALERAVARLVHDPVFMARLEPPSELNASPDGRLFASSDVSVALSKVHRLSGYSVGSRRIAVGSVEWELAFELGTLEKAGVGRLQRTVPVVCGVSALVWLGEEPPGSEHAAEVSRVVNVRAATA